MITSKFYSIVFFLFLFCFTLSTVVSGAEPVAWPTPLAEEGNDDPPDDDPGGGLGLPPCIAVFGDISSTHAEPTAVQSRVWREESVMTGQSERRSPPWVVWFDLFVILLH